MSVFSYICFHAYVSTLRYPRFPYGHSPTDLSVTVQRGKVSYYTVKRKHTHPSFTFRPSTLETEEII